VSPETAQTTDSQPWKPAARGITGPDAAGPDGLYGEDAMAGDDLIAALSEPHIYPGSPPHVEVRETHISWVFLAGERAYKLKKEIVLPFLDYGSAERRHAMCREEVRLDRRLARDLYLGVLGVAPAPAGGYELTTEDDPRAIDYLVEMRRFDERATLGALVERGERPLGAVADVGAALAAFHASARAVAPDADPVGAAERQFARNLEELLGTGALDAAATARVRALGRFAGAFVAAHRRTFAERAAGDCIREGHGDLRAEHVLLGADTDDTTDLRLAIVDCVEFDPALRELDVADDLAFLVLDLEALGAPELAEGLVAGYRAAGGDPGGDPLIAFYAAYRALVRAKVGLVRASQQPPESRAARGLAAAAAEWIDLAERFAWRARRPLVLVICGVPASGKSVLAQALAVASGLERISSDATRKRLAGVSLRSPAPAPAYTPQFSALTYRELGAAAARAAPSSR
jgi:aminoglycoside phosphotransferase family enzyme